MMVVLRCLLLSALVATLLTGKALADRRVALLIGNSDYAAAPALKNPRADVGLVGSALEDVGFEVTTRLDLTRSEIAGELSDFLDREAGADLTLFYFAGHGMQFENRNFLLGTDADLRSSLDVEDDGLDLQRVLALMSQRTKAALVFIDACRDNPLAHNFYTRNYSATRAAATRGLARMPSAFQGTMVTFSASPGQVAYDGEGVNSPFAKALARHIPTANVELLSLTKRIIGDVREATDGRQSPLVTNDLTREVFLRSAVASTTTSKPIDPEKLLFDVARSEDTVSAWNMFLRQFPSGALHEEAENERRRLVGLVDPDAVEQRNIAVTRRPLLVQQSFRRPSRTDVIAVQRALNRSPVEDVSVDGVMGAQTRASIQQLQGFVGEPQSGALTKRTLLQLGLGEMVPETPFETFVSGRDPELHAIDFLEATETDPRIHNLGKFLDNRKFIYGSFSNRIFAIVPLVGETPSEIVVRAAAYGIKIAIVESELEEWFVYGLARNSESLWILEGSSEFAKGPLVGNADWDPSDPSRELGFNRLSVNLNPSSVGPVGLRPAWEARNKTAKAIVFEIE